MLENYFRRMNKAALLNKRQNAVLTDKDRIVVVHLIVDFMIEALGQGNPNEITQHHKTLTARAAIRLFVALEHKVVSSTIIGSTKEIQRQTFARWFG